MQPARLLAFDPGLTTGVAIFEGDVLSSAYTVAPDARLDYLTARFPVLLPDDVVVCEDFIGHYLTSEARETLKLIGMLEYLARVRTGRPPIYQRAQARLSFLDAAKDALRVYVGAGPLHAEHRLDAIAHGLKYLYDHPVEQSAVRYA